MANKPEVIERVKELTSRMVSKTILSKNYVIDAKIENVEKALGRRPVRLSRRIKIDDEWIIQTDEVYVYEGAVANAALKALGQEVGLFKDKLEVKVTNEYSHMSDKELAEKLVELGQRVLLEAPEGPVIEHESTEEDDAS